MGQAATMSTAAAEIEMVAAAIGRAVPYHWTGRAAEAYRRTAINLGTALVGAGDRARTAAGQIHQHELEMAAVRTALGAGGAVAV